MKAEVVVAGEAGWEGPGGLLGRYELVGPMNRDLTSEALAATGAAFGTAQPVGSHVTVSCDGTFPSAMAQAALASGLASTGVQVVDLGAVPRPVARFSIRTTSAVGGMQVCQLDGEEPHVAFYGPDGQDLDEAVEHAVEAMFLGGVVRRLPYTDLGTIVYDTNAADLYMEALAANLDRETLKRTSCRVVVSHSGGLGAGILPALLRRHGFEVVGLNAKVSGNNGRQGRPAAVRMARLSGIVPALDAGLGVAVDESGEYVHLVDERGTSLTPMQSLIVLSSLVLEGERGATVAVPVDAPLIFERLADRYRGHVVRCNDNVLTWAAKRKGVHLAGDGRGRFIVPRFHTAFDAMRTMFLLLEMLARSGRTLGDVVADLPDLTGSAPRLRAL